MSTGTGETTVDTIPADIVVAANELFLVAEQQRNEGALIEAFELYKRVLDMTHNQHSDALFLVGSMMGEKEMDIQYNPEQSINYIQAAADLGNTRAMCSLAYIYFESGTVEGYEKAYQLYEQAAANDDPEAFSQLGYIWHTGEGVEPNIEKALYYYKKAASLGFADAQYNLGSLYLAGEVVPIDQALAREYFESAASKNHAGAQLAIGLIYKEGVIGLPQDYQKAAEYFEKATLTNSEFLAQAQYEYGYCLLFGQGVEKNTEDALGFIGRAADVGNNADAQFCLACLYKDGEVIEANSGLCMYWLTKAAEGGNADAVDSIQNLENVVNANGLDNNEMMMTMTMTSTDDDNVEENREDGNESSERNEENEYYLLNQTRDNEQQSELETEQNTLVVDDDFVSPLLALPDTPHSPNSTIENVSGNITETEEQNQEQKEQLFDDVDKMNLSDIHSENTSEYDTIEQNTSTIPTSAADLYDSEEKQPHGTTDMTTISAVSQIEVEADVDAEAEAETVEAETVSEINPQSTSKPVSTENIIAINLNTLPPIEPESTSTFTSTSEYFENRISLSNNYQPSRDSFETFSNSTSTRDSLILTDNESLDGNNNSIPPKPTMHRKRSILDDNPFMLQAKSGAKFETPTWQKQLQKQIEESQKQKEIREKNKQVQAKPLVIDHSNTQSVQHVIDKILTDESKLRRNESIVAAARSRSNSNADRDSFIATIAIEQEQEQEQEQEREQEQEQEQEQTEEVKDIPVVEVEVEVEETETEAELEPEEVNTEVEVVEQEVEVEAEPIIVAAVELEAEAEVEVEAIIESESGPEAEPEPETKSEVVESEQDSVILQINTDDNVNVIITMAGDSEPEVLAKSENDEALEQLVNAIKDDDISVSEKSESDVVVVVEEIKQNDVEEVEEVVEEAEPIEEAEPVEEVVEEVEETEEVEEVKPEAGIVVVETVAEDVKPIEEEDIKVESVESQSETIEVEVEVAEGGETCVIITNDDATAEEQQSKQEKEKEKEKEEPIAATKELQAPKGCCVIM